MQNRLTSEIEKRINEKVKETVEKVNKFFKMEMPIPPVYYDVTGTTAGLAKYNSMSVHLNPTILLNNLEDSINNTVPHEVCHLSTYFEHLKTGRAGFPKAHGKSWQLMMHVVGVPPRVTHEYDVEELKKKRTEYLYLCNCENPIKVSSIIHNKIKKGNRYKCKRCNAILHSGERILKHVFSHSINKELN